VPGEFDSQWRQQSIFTILNLILLVALWAGHTCFAGFWGQPSGALLALLAASFALRAGELLWLRRRVLRRRDAVALTCCSIAFNLALAIVLASVVDREDSQYAALLAVPILESAFQFGRAATLAVATAADGIVFYWVWRYFHLHPPTKVGEYFEAGTLSLILLIVGVLGSAIVQRLRQKQEQLEHTRERLLQQEKMAAVGRLSSAMAHEIRNPVAMISSSLSTARTMEGSEREQMLEIAGMESSRLVKLTSDLLSYSKPRRPVPAKCELRDTVSYVANTCHAHAASKGVAIDIDAPENVPAEYDEAFLQQALMNLVLNAVDASPPGTAVSLSVKVAAGDQARIEVENPGGPIPAGVVDRLFEPFFTTKPQGTGFGLATAYSLMLAQGGDLMLTGNSQTVRFTMMIPIANARPGEVWRKS
jgi:signal transduction histidine kinase